MNLCDFGQPWLPTGERSGLQTRIAATESVSLCTRRKNLDPWAIRWPITAITAISTVSRDCNVIAIDISLMQRASPTWLRWFHACTGGCTACMLLALHCCKSVAPTSPLSDSRYRNSAAFLLFRPVLPLWTILITPRVSSAPVIACAS